MPRLPAFQNAAAAAQIDYLHGYRRFEANNRAPRFWFGYGLSYTTYEYSNLQVLCSNLTATGRLNVQVTVKNTGTMAGDEVVQLYIGYPNTAAEGRPKSSRPSRASRWLPARARTFSSPSRLPTWRIGLPTAGRSRKSSTAVLVGPSADPTEALVDQVHDPLDGDRELTTSLGWGRRLPCVRSARPWPPAFFRSSPILARPAPSRIQSSPAPPARRPSTHRRPRRRNKLGRTRAASASGVAPWAAGLFEPAPLARVARWPGDGRRVRLVLPRQPSLSSGELPRLSAEGSSSAPCCAATSRRGSFFARRAKWSRGFANKGTSTRSTSMTCTCSSAKGNLGHHRGRFMTWRVYRKGLGWDLYTLEDTGADTRTTTPIPPRFLPALVRGR